MANIIVTNLNASIIGTDLFGDLESFMSELSESELELQGGLFSTCISACGFVSYRLN
jgi:hypothetical protein